MSDSLRFNASIAEKETSNERIDWKMQNSDAKRQNFFQYTTAVEILRANFEFQATK